MGRNRRMAAALKGYAEAEVRMDTGAWAILEREEKRRQARQARLEASRRELEVLDDTDLVKRLERHAGVNDGPVTVGRDRLIDLIQAFEVPL